MKENVSVKHETRGCETCPLPSKVIQVAELLLRSVVMFSDLFGILSAALEMLKDPQLSSTMLAKDLQIPLDASRPEK